MTATAAHAERYVAAWNQTDPMADAEGRIRTVLGFLDRVPAGA